MATDDGKCTIKEFIAFFGPNVKGDVLSATDIIAFKKNGGDSYDIVSRGIADGSLTY